MQELTTTLLAPSSALPSSILVEILADYEAQACLLFTNEAVTGEVEVVRTFYSSYLIALLMVDDLYVYARTRALIPLTSTTVQKLVF